VNFLLARYCIEKDILLIDQANMTIQHQEDAKHEDSVQDKAQPLVSELLHGVAPNLAFPLVLSVKSCDRVLSLPTSTALRSIVLLHECH
jgi:hypothetical protein